LTELLSIDRATFDADFATRPFRVEHALADHPLLSLDSIGALADRVPEASVEHNRGNVPEVVDADAVERVELTPGEIARTIDTNGCWMVLKNIEQDPQFKGLLDETLDQVAPLVAGREGGMRRREGFIFLSAPNSVTPSHIDPEHNFLLQVRGWKEMHVGSFADAATEQRVLEAYHSGGHRNLEWAPDSATAYRLDPGQGIYVPVHAPHFVRNGDAVSISLSITWYTPAVDRAARVHALNARLRKLRLSPQPPGRRQAADHAKAGAVVALGAAKRVARARKAA
jgi:JmjC domain